MTQSSAPPRRLIAASLGFLGPSAQARRIRRILELALARPRAGWPEGGDAVLAWGHSPRAWRAEALTRRTGAALWRVEDAWIRSIQPARVGHEPPVGLLVDTLGMHYDPTQPSELEHLLATHPLDDGRLVARARLCLERLRALHLSKYNSHDPALPPPDPGYVLVIDQVRGDASLTRGAPGGPLPAERVFREMLVRAQEDNPGARVLIRAHPETAQGRRAGYYGPADAQGRVGFIDGPHSPWSLFEGAVAVYTVSSQMGFEAILAGHRPRVFGAPFYAGWGLSEDEAAPPRRQRALTRIQMFALAMVLYPLWYDPLRDRLCGLEEVIDQMEARLVAFRQDRNGHDAVGIRLWKRPHMQAFFGREKPLRFVRASDRTDALGWASAVGPDFAGLRVEDGFVRSKGLGAALVPPLSLAVDDLGIYYDPTRESRLERLIAGPLPPGGEARARALRAALLAGRVTKYNLPAGPTDPAARVAALRAERPGAEVILIPGQVEDDASIRLGAGSVRTNRALLEAARTAHPDAILLFKPHPDVEAGLRDGAVPDADRLADLVLADTDAPGALDLADRVWTMTSGLGFEALLRGIPVTTLGAPFYAGWGLTDDRGPVPDRRLRVHPRPDLDRLTHAALIAYPRYLDPLTRIPCPPELAVERLAHGLTGRPAPSLRALARLQGALASYAPLWRHPRG
ncbi:MAG TPA: capsular polysaccharide biosynthesis protein [Pararhodobacter sp.]|uniref:capsular polysaccharide biosynthesis protein n=1 Tax=Pararhodobacter sp. TaxID=2127056 RepID=UPI001D37EEC9|nr:capsular polysaccharide biosynthesis protein [Pararhodobacter sp.]MCB1344962.1 capsular polysaccharide biosynthesis protein [Paracoccaceae bacterium]HPD91441.1 capsular polysaccharide biosynthesis protein [Pararhodobacter sp.]